MKKGIALCLLLGLLLSGCTTKSATMEEPLQLVGEQEASSASELEAFFISGGHSVRLGSDIDMGDTMLKLAASRGPVEIIGNGHSISASAPCAIRLEDGCAITLTGVTLLAGQTGIGLLGSGTLTASDTVISADINAIQAAGSLLLDTAAGALTLNSSEGSGILALGVSFKQNSTLEITAAVAAINTGRGDLTLHPNVKVSCSAAGDNVVKADGTLVLMEGSVLETTNTGEHNGARIGALSADQSATLHAKGGVNGVGLFVVELYDNVTLKGASVPELKIEAGKGKLTFET